MLYKIYIILYYINIMFFVFYCFYINNSIHSIYNIKQKLEIKSFIQQGHIKLIKSDSIQFLMLQ